MAAFLELSQVSKGYGSGAARTEVLRDVTLKVAKGEFVAILGYSGSGKTTLMSLLAGLIRPDSGVVLHKDKEVDGPSPARGLVFQNYSLLPWLTVEQNVAISVDQLYAKESAAQRRQRVRDTVEMVNLTPALHKKPGELSGGMRQRTSVARTLAGNPEVLLLDEPLSALDALTRSVLQDQILEIREKLHQTIILITNDVDEGLYMADRIIPLSMGPGATFGPEVTVDLARPRSRAALNHDEEFKHKRRIIIEYLLEQRRADSAASSAAEATLPAVKPVDLSRSGAGIFGKFFGAHAV
jgi:nitrate/nitrite transport system ATP-binding protein